MRIARFTCDVTPPLGHPLCGGWIQPASEIVDPLSAHGIILQPKRNDPIVLMAVDWCWIRGEAHQRWREAIAERVDTPPHRVAIQCVHQHDAIMADPAADRILAAAGDDLRSLQEGFLDEIIERTAAVAAEQMQQARNLTHIGMGRARVEQVAANRRVIGPDGTVVLWRGSSSRNQEAQAAPEGLIDPWLRCITFWDGDEPLAALHYYATHPMSYYGKGGVSADFAGLARERCRQEDQGVHHVYFTGCAGDVAAGKYNDGSPEQRPILTDRIHSAMRAAYAAQVKEPFRSFQWRVEPVHLPMREEFPREYFTEMLERPGAPPGVRGRGAMGLGWWEWFQSGGKIDLTCLRINDALVLHLPAEPFIAYQLFAQEAAGAADVPDDQLPRPFVAVAGYGDCGPAYIPTAEAYPQGGYEVTMAWVGPKADEVMRTAIRKLVQ